ncbi:CAP domain-containing protein [Yoonia sp. BS5-3]|uniref:CAP domain-containing protein n=1 Tax=Yoonia phaeophyticola TaxID=3137369 RepID=A0ABZ2V7S0_9RHOB
MTCLIRFAAALALSLLATTGSAATRDCVAPDNVNALATEIAAGVNANRRAAGEAPLRFNRRLGQAAMVHACDMQVHDFFDHRGSDGSNSQRRVRAAGYDDCIVAENIAWGYPQPAQIITGWMNSAGHRRNMMHPRIEEFGIGITQGPKGPYWVLVVGKQC